MLSKTHFLKVVPLTRTPPEPLCPLKLAPLSHATATRQGILRAPLGAALAYPLRR